VKSILLAKAEAGAAIILTTHILEVAERLADRIGIIAQGRLKALGSLADLRATGGANRDLDTLEDVFLRLVGPAAAEAA
jgi:ABC-2 type transport system ATP-binding protein